MIFFFFFENLHTNYIWKVFISPGMKIFFISNEDLKMTRVVGAEKFLSWLRREWLIDIKNAIPHNHSTFDTSFFKFL